MTAGAWRFDPFARISRFVGEFVEPDDSELSEYAYEKPKMADGSAPIKHGTEGGYRRHRKRGDEACAACKEANSAASKARKAARKVAA